MLQVMNDCLDKKQIFTVFLLFPSCVKNDKKEIRLILKIAIFLIQL